MSIDVEAVDLNTWFLDQGGGKQGSMVIQAWPRSMLRNALH